MLILAGVAISALTGDGGLFDKTLKSAEAYENAAQKEAKQLDILMNEIDGYIGDLTADKKAPSVAKLEVSNITDTGFTLTATGKDNVGISKYEFYIKNDDGSFTLEKTIESEDTTVTYDVTGKDLKQNSYTYKLKVYDKSGNSKESSELLIEALDTTAPTVATLVASNVTDTGFTLTATGEDDKGIVKYEFYIKDAEGNFKLERTMEVSGNTAVYNVTGKTPKSNSYEYKVIVYDKAGNSKESDVITVGAEKLASKVKIGDYVNYDAGVWTQEDLEKIANSQGNPTLVSTVNDENSDNQTPPTIHKQFGGFELGQSRNTNAVYYVYNGTKSYPNAEGWRVWDIDNNTGVVTLIHAGFSECYCHFNNSDTSIVVLKNRDCTMYVNDFSTEAHILTGQELATWYNARFGTNYYLKENDGRNIMVNKDTASTLHGKGFPKYEPASVITIGRDFWLASVFGPGTYNSTYNYMGHLYDVWLISNSNTMSVGASQGGAKGIRILVTLKSDIQLDPSSGDGSVDNPWKLSQ